jgi:hypothetical protein
MWTPSDDLGPPGLLQELPTAISGDTTDHGTYLYASLMIIILVSATRVKL